MQTTTITNREATEQAELSISRNREIYDLRTQYPKMSYSAAFQQVRQQLPHLFGLEPRGTTPVANRAAVPPDDAANLRAIQDGIEELRVKNRKLTYCAARDILRTKRPALFGL